VPYSLAVAFAVTVPVGLITMGLTQSGGLMLAAITTIATITSGAVCRRVARRRCRAEI
jgi:hypothetical protein